MDVLAKQTAYYYEVSFCYRDKTTKESLDLCGEGGLSWYVRSDKELTKEAVVNKCIESIKASGKSYDLCESVDYVSYVKEISEQEFAQLCGILI